MSDQANQNAYVPPKRTFTIEFYVGVFSIIGLMCIGYLMLNIAGIKIFDTNYYHVIAEFDNISGLNLGAQIEIAGVPVGEVSKIELVDTSAVVEMKIRKEVPLRDDDIAGVRTKGVIGDKYVKITPGGSEDVVGPGGKLTDTESAIEIEDVIGKFIHRME